MQTTTASARSRARGRCAWDAWLNEARLLANQGQPRDHLSRISKAPSALQQHPALNQPTSDHRASYNLPAPSERRLAEVQFPMHPARPRAWHNREHMNSKRGRCAANGVSQPCYRQSAQPRGREGCSGAVLGHPSRKKQAPTPNVERTKLQRQHLSKIFCWLHLQLSVARSCAHAPRAQAMPGACSLAGHGASACHWGSPSGVARTTGHGITGQRLYCPSFGHLMLIFSQTTAKR